MKILRVLLVCSVAAYALLLFAPTVFAATVTWTNPTQFEDGSALAAADIASTTVEWSNAQPFGAVTGSLVVSGAAASTSAPPDPPAGGTFCYRARTTVVAAKGGGTSVPSNTACKTKGFSNPKPPTLLDAIIAFLRRLFGHFA